MAAPVVASTELERGAGSALPSATAESTKPAGEGVADTNLDHDATAGKKKRKVALHVAYVGTAFKGAPTCHPLRAPILKTLVYGWTLGVLWDYNSLSCVVGLQGVCLVGWYIDLSNVSKRELEIKCTDIGSTYLTTSIAFCILA